MLGLNFKLEGLDNEDETVKEKYLFVEDMHAMGEIEMLENEAGKKENITNLVTFIGAFTLMAIATIMCCYFNYKFEREVARQVFWLFVLAWFMDMLFFRLLFILIMALFRLCNGKRLGYEPIVFLSSKEVN